MEKLLSVIIPAYNEENMILKCMNTVSSILEENKMLYELIFINDGSKDGTWDEIKKACAQNENIRGICFSRNFGKEASMFAGLEYCKGDCCVLMDCDLQHPPIKIVEMYSLWNQGYEVVEAIKSDRGKETRIHKFFADLFYKIISKVTNIDMENASDFKLLDRKAINVLLNLKERNAFFRALSSWIGFKTIQIPFEVQERTIGESKWSTFSLVKYAISNITSFSTAPMQIVTILGVIMLFSTLIFGALAIYQKIVGIALGGFTTVILLLLFIGSIIMISLGIIGYYIAKIYDEIKGRPRYIVSDYCQKRNEN